MSKIIKLQASQETPTVNVPTNVNSGKLVRILNVDAAAEVLITQKTALPAADTVGTITLEFGQELFITKEPTDTLEFSGGHTTDVLMVSVAFA